VETPASDEVLIFDAGTGIRELGSNLLSTRKGPLKIHLLLTHFHWDHVLGLPFFAPAYNPGNELTIYATNFVAPLEPSITAVMSYPHFPVVMLKDLPHIRFHKLDSGPIQLAGAKILPFRVNHPQGSCGYQIRSSGATVLFVPDREGGDEQLDLEIRKIAQGADLLIHDAQYTADEYRSKKGWGHSTCIDAAQLAAETRVKQLVLFHHDPDHDDVTIEQMLSEAKAIFPNTRAAAEGCTIDL